MGLESIAMAVDLLEKRDAQRESEDNVRSTPPPEAAPMIPRSTFASAPRQVSSDSMCGHVHTEVPFPTAASGESPLASVKDSMSAEMISLVVESLADDADYNFTGPPPKAPLPSVSITKVQENDVLCGRGGETK
mgnify:CR=1 FL=1